MTQQPSTQKLLRLSVLPVFVLLAALSGRVVAEVKIGYVNAVKVIEEAPQGVAALRKLETEFSPRDKELVALQNKIRTLDEEIQKNGPAMKEADRHAREREILVLKRELKRSTQEFREDYNQRRNEELAALQSVVRKAIIEIARQEKYDLILHEGVVYSGESVDITDKVLKKLGRQ
jgi:outer membrane protein